MRTVIDEMDRQDYLRGLCAQVWGEDESDFHCQRVMARSEREAKHIALTMGNILVELKRTQNAD